MKNSNWITPFISRYSWHFTLFIVIGTLTIVFGGSLMFTSGYLISKSATQPESILMVYVPIVGVRTVGIGRAALSYVERLIGHNLILKILSKMRIRLYNIIEPQALFIRSRFRTGDILGILADDIEHLQDFYLKTLVPSIVSLIIYAVIIISAGIFSIPFAILLAVFMGLIVFVGPIVSLLVIKAKNKQIKKGRNTLYKQFTDAVFGISDWIFSGHYAGYIERYEQQERKLLELETKKHQFVNIRDILQQIILGTTVILTIYYANDLTLSGEIPPTLIAAFALVLLSLLETFLPLAGSVSETTTYQESIKRLESFTTSEQIKEVFLTDNKVPSQIAITISDLTFGFHNEILLDHIQLNVEQGEKVAVLGRSGSGKSTLLNLVQGALVPTHGAVKIAGQDAVKLGPGITKYMSILNQKAYLFNTTVLNNIRLGNPEATDDEVYRVTQMVGLDEMIKKLPSGYETNMQETGQRFSGGERQRIALARILLQNTPVVILDEPTVGLDPITEVKLLTTIFETLKGKTIIWVTHHLIGVEKVDRILFLDHGKFVMEGSHQELLENNQRYRRLYALDRPLIKRE